MDTKKFSARLTELRTQKGISARDMSLNLGQNPSYINSIETGKAMPSMANFFYICDYLKITPKEFFDTDEPQPEDTRRLTQTIKKLDAKKIKIVTSLLTELLKNQS